MMKAANNPGADIGALSWGQVTSEFKRVNTSLLALMPASAASKNHHAVTEIANGKYFPARTAAQTLTLDVATWAVGEAPPGQAIGGNPSVGMSEISAGVKQFCG